MTLTEMTSNEPSQLAHYSGYCGLRSLQIPVTRSIVVTSRDPKLSLID